MRWITRTTTTIVAVAVLVSAGSALGARSPQPGIDPAKEPLVGSFSCYTTAAGDAYQTPGFTLEILPGRQYRTPQGSGVFAVDPSETLSVSWTSGPFAGSLPSPTRFTDQGQSISGVRPAGATRDSNCFQKGARDAAAQNVFRAKDPVPGDYPCINEDTGAAAETVTILAGRRYSVGGQEGGYSLDILGQQRDPWSSVDFDTGPLAGAFGLYVADPETGVRNLTIGLNPSFDCVVVVAPTPDPLYGAARVAQGKVVKNAIIGTYASFQIDVTGICGGLCWTVYSFTNRGWVLAREPRVGRGDVDCRRTLPNGLSLCERYVVRGRTIRIGDAPPVPFARGPNRLRIDGRTFHLVRPLPVGRRLNGAYRSQTIILPLPGTSGSAATVTYTFTPHGRFTREGTAGAFSTPPFGQPGVAVTVASRGGSAGRYRVLPQKNTIELRFDNGVVKRLFMWVPVNSGALPRPRFLRLGGGNYLSK